MCSGLDRYIYFVILQLSCIDAFYHSADHNSSFSKRIQINHSSCSNHIIHKHTRGRNDSLIGTLGIYSWTILSDFLESCQAGFTPPPQYEKLCCQFFSSKLFQSLKFVTNLQRVVFLLDGTNRPRFLESYLV